jgi:hypothetical protein
MEEQTAAEHEKMIQNIASKLELNFEDKNPNAFRQNLVDVIEYLIHKNPEKLSWILYRIDVNEEFLKQELRENNEQNAAEIIADMIIEREIQKINKGDVGSTDSWSFDME